MDNLSQEHDAEIRSPVQMAGETAELTYRLRLENLYRVVADLNRADTLAEVYRIAARGAAELLQADRSSVLIFGPDEQVHFVAWRNLSRPYRQKVDGHSPWRPHETDAQPIFIPNISRSGLPDSLKETILNEGIQAIGFVPLVAPQRLLGKFMVYYNRPHNCNDEGQRLAQILADNLAAIILRMQALETSRQAIAELRISEERYRTLHDYNPAMYFTLDVAGQVIAVNQYGAERLGYEVEELLGQSVLAVFHPEEHQKVREQLQNCVDNPFQLFHWELRKIHKDGRVLWVSETARAVKNAAGEIIVLVVCDDITVRKQAAERIAELAEFNENIISSAPMGIVTVSKEGKITSANEAFLKIMGSPGLAETLKLSLNIPSVERAGLSDAFHKTLIEGKPFEIKNLPYTSHWGKELIVNLKGVPQKSRDGRISGMIIVVDDVTAAARAEKALRHSEEKMRSLARMAQKLEKVHTYDEIVQPLREEIQMVLGYQSVWIYLFDEDREHFRLLVSAGEMAVRERAQTFRVEEDALLKEVLLADCPVVVADARTDSRTNKRVVEQFANRTIINVPIMLERRQLGVLATGTFGAEGVRTPSPAELDYLEAVARHVAVVLDRIRSWLDREKFAQALQESNRQLQSALDELKETQERMVQRERLAAVGQLAAGMAHDFNNIMAVIVLYIQMSLRTPELPPKMQKQLQTVLDQAWRAADLVEQILDFSRRAVLEPRPVNLTPLLEEQVELLRRTLPENIQIQLTCGQDSYIINVDPTRMQQVVMNLAINARDAMPAGGILRLALARVTTTRKTICAICQQPVVGEWVQLQVTDNGSGITPTVMPRIFEPFFTTKQVGQGSGLGLPQIAGIVEQHGGHMAVKTEVGAGTTFTVYLPLSFAWLPHEWAGETGSLESGRGETVLIVEDDANVREALTDNLVSLNYTVLTAVNGQEALAVLEKCGPEVSLVLTDMVMPEMGGAELLRAIRQRGFSMPVIALSGYSAESNFQSLQEEGLAGWLPKPVDIAKLAQLLAQTLRAG